LWKRSNCHAEKQASGEYLVGDKLSWADIILYNFVQELPSQAALKDAPKVVEPALHSPYVYHCVL
jgi:glutathione S-transferase